MESIAHFAMEILRLQLPVEGFNIRIFVLVVGMLIIYRVLKIIFQRKEG